MKRCFSFILLILMMGTLPGCNTYLLLKSTSGGSSEKKQWSKDNITGFSVSTKNEVTFVGKYFDYLIVKGGGEIAQLLNSQDIKPDELGIEGAPKFIIDDTARTFDGKVNVTAPVTQKNRNLLINNYSFRCNQDKCSKIIDISGTLHEKATDNEIKFQHPFDVVFYQYQTVSGHPGVAKALMPVAITLDIITAPVQLLAGALVYSDY
ncbi:YidX family protein [Yersinia pekkanenii]|uniref:Lipoprotein n=1 Tax=Yersinia pekkanenii TaxID=1288385 RepID=A0A0T9RC66_9GAMM|nr:hypothetical protein [Yersinia pekkanenii]CNI55581.1 putative lipoprotein [Yersinia pekkanenii]CRY67322.1 putative lipoprotein [Yersinia pekkanenii]